MPDAIINSPARLYIGFGGSGSKTLAEFAETIVRHAQWGHQAETNLAFLLVDTDRGDLAESNRRIREACARIARDPIVEMIQTSDGVTNFQHYAATRFEGRGHDRLRSAWWHDATGRPFTARRLTGSPIDGAGQCPLVSTFLAWNNLPQIEDRIRGIVEQLQRRLSLGAGDQNWTLDTTIIAGLAGGTGRGCWHILATKVREVLARIGRQTTPVGFFFDASVFQDVMNANPGEALKMRINSLTGFSELVAWMRNEQQHSPYRFQLPHIERAADATSDVIDVTRITSNAEGKRLENVQGNSPVNQAFVVFAAGKAGRPGAKDNYYTIVANALYARLVREIASKSVNSAAFGGIGAASVTVPIEEIKEYVEGYIRQYLPAMFARAGDLPAIEKWAKRLTAGLVIPEAFSFEASANGNLGERILHGVKSNQEAVLRNINDAIERKQYRRVENDCKRIHEWPESEMGKEEIRDIATREVAETFWGEQPAADARGTGGLLRDLGFLDTLGPVDFARLFGGKVDGKPVARLNTVAEAVRQLLMREQLRLPNADGTHDELPIGSFRVKATLATQIASRLQDIAQAIKARCQVGAGDPTSPGSRSPRDEFEKARNGIISSGIDAQEAQRINETAWDWLRVRSMAAVQAAVCPILNQAADELKRFAGDLDAVVAGFDRAHEEAASAIKTRRKQLFWTPEDFEELLSAPTDQLFDRDLLAEHRLQPVENDAALHAALDDLTAKAANTRFRSFWDAFEERLTAWLTSPEATAAGAQRQREQDLRRMIDTGVAEMARNLVIPASFFERNYGFFETVRGLLARWGTELANRAGSEQEATKLHSAFRILFGMKYPCERDGVAIQYRGADLDAFTTQVCRAMTIDLAVRCDVLFQVRRDERVQRQDDVVAVVLPCEELFDDKFSRDVVAQAKDQGKFVRDGSLSPHPTFGHHAGGNPFLMLAYAQENFPDWADKDGAGLDSVASLRYYDDHDLRLWLDACEDETGSSVFMPDGTDLPLKEASFGLGFISPEFVRNETLRALRWRPWAAHRQGVANARRTRSLDTLAYALLDEPATDEAISLSGLHESRHWQMPLLNFKPSAQPGQSQFEFARSAFRDDLGKLHANHPAMKAGQGYTSIGKMVEALEGAAGSSTPLVDAIAAEAVIYLGTILPSNDELVAPDDALTMLWRDLRGRIEAAKLAASGPQRERFVKLYDELLDRITRLHALGAKGLKEHFEQRGGG